MNILQFIVYYRLNCILLKVFQRVFFNPSSKISFPFSYHLYLLLPEYLSQIRPLHFFKGGAFQTKRKNEKDFILFFLSRSERISTCGIPILKNSEERKSLGLFHPSEPMIKSLFIASLGSIRHENIATGSFFKIK